MRSSEPCSKPLVRLTTGIHGWMCALTSSSVWRKACDGTATTSNCAEATDCSRSGVAVSSRGRENPLRYDSFVAFSLISKATEGLRAHRVVACRLATSEATVVPHEPAPNTVMRMSIPQSAADSGQHSGCYNDTAGATPCA